MRQFVILDNIPPEYTRLTDAISALFYACGSQKLCGACFAGKLDLGNGWQKRRPSSGCCQGCENLGPAGCLQKPLGCASWTCEWLRALVPVRVVRFKNDALGILRERGVYVDAFRTGGFAQRHTASQLRAMLRVAIRVERVVAWMKRTGYPQPDWEKMKQVTNAEEGAFV